MSMGEIYTTIEKLTGSETHKPIRRYATKQMAERRRNALLKANPEFIFFVQKVDIGIMSADIRYSVAVDHYRLPTFNGMLSSARLCV